MRQSKYFIKTLRQPPADEVSYNAKILEQAGYIHKLMAGAYTYLPLGLRVLNKIMNIIRKEIDATGGQELYMPALQPKELWDTTNRWEELKGVMYQFKGSGDKWVGLGATHEETITAIIKQRITSYKDLPIYLYQIQDKFRNEPRAKSGLIRGREFSMKDLYSFHADEDDLAEYYEIVKQSYLNIFQRCNLNAIIIEASGGSFSKSYSHEFQVLSEAGEDKIIYCPKFDYAQNKEISKFNENDECPKCKTQLKSGKGIEVGNIFKLGTRFSESLKAYYLDSQGNKKPIVMASYGIGPGRLMGTIVETHHDSNGIIWPKCVSPFQLHLIQLGNNGELKKKSSKIYNNLQKSGFEVLYDDRDESAGIKFKDADLLGISVRAVISDKTKDKIEIKYRDQEQITMRNESGVISELKKYYNERIQ